MLIYENKQKRGLLLGLRRANSVIKDLRRANSATSALPARERALEALPDLSQESSQFANPFPPAPSLPKKRFKEAYESEEEELERNRKRRAASQKQVKVAFIGANSRDDQCRKEVESFIEALGESIHRAAAQAAEELVCLLVMRI